LGLYSYGFGVIAFSPGFFGQLMQLVALAPLGGYSLRGLADELAKPFQIVVVVLIGKDFRQPRSQTTNG
jgi:hypothetical protein